MSGTNRVTVCERPGRIGLDTRPMPDLGDGQVLVRVGVCGVCGSDVAAWQGEQHRQYPCTPGHEFCGTIEALGVDAGGLETGQMVVIDPNLECGRCPFCEAGRPNLCDNLKGRPIKSNGGFSDYVALDARMVHPLPAEIPVAVAPFIEPLSCACHAARRLAPRDGDAVVVFGAGALGLLTVLALGSTVAGVTVVEPSEARRRGAAAVPGVTAVSPREFEDGGERMDRAVDCSGAATAVSQAIRLLRKGGRLVLAGVAPGDAGADIPLGTISRKELDVMGTWLNPGTFAEAIELAARSVGVLSQLATKTFPLENVAAAFEQARSTEQHKVLVRP